MKFKTPKSKKGMTDREYLKSVFYRNRKEIVEVFGKETPMQKFINNIEAQKVIGNLTTRQALNKLAKSEAFTPTVNRLKENIQSALKKYGRAKEFKNLIKDERGRFTKFDTEKLVWDKHSGMYIYDNRITIDISNSPEDVIIGRL